MRQGFTPWRAVPPPHEDGYMTTPPVEDRSADAATPAAPPAPRRETGSDRFFAWTSGLGIVRGDGWIGGVAAGIAARLRIDPLIVRGILVVAALFGLPVLFVYALAWALLPNLDGDIPLRSALRGVFSPAQLGIAGIAVLAVLGIVGTGVIPVFFGWAPWWSGGLSVWSLVNAALTICGIAIVAALVVIIVRAARHAPPAPQLSAAFPGSGPDDAFADSRGVEAAGFAASTPAPLDEDDAATSGADPDAAYAAWREQHAEWRTQEDAWRHQQQDAARAARDQARRERHANAAAFTADAAERRRVRRLTAPRTPFAYVAVVLGVAVIVGALVALASGRELAAASGLFAATLVVALGMAVAGAVRRRSGFLAFVTVALLASGLTATAVPTLGSLHIGNYGISNEDTEKWPASAPFVQPWGSVSVTLIDTKTETNPIYIEKRSGVTHIQVDNGVALSLDLTVPAGVLTAYDDNGDQVSLDELKSTELPDGRVRYTGVIVAGDAEPTTQQRLVLDQRSGWVNLQTYAITED